MTRYTSSHEWIRLVGARGVVGISEHAQKELGEVVYIELPQVGTKLVAKQECCVLESTKAASDVYAPVSGTVVAVNHALIEHPEKVNQSAETEGWLFEVELTNPTELDLLLSKEEYTETT